MTPAITIRPVRTPRERRQFIAFPYALYRGSDCWVPPLRREQRALIDPKRHPFFEHGSMELFLALDAGGAVAGRIAAILNEMHRSRHGPDLGFFGLFECRDEPEAARALLDAAGAWLRAQGCTRMTGPVNPSINETSGVLVDGFDRAPSVMMPYNPPYYAPLLESCGLLRAQTMWAYYGAWKHLNRERMRRGAALVRQRMPGLRVRNPDLRRFTEETLLLHRLYNASFAGTWGHVPMTEAEFLHAGAAMRRIMDPDLVFIAEDEGAPVGFALSLPDVNPVLRRVPDGRLTPFGAARLLAYGRFAELREFRTMLLAVLPAYRRRGVDAVLVDATLEAGRRRGYVASELSWVMDDNVPLRNALRRLGAVVDKEYALFARPL